MASPEVQVERLSDDGTFPNSDRLPLLIYKRAVDLHDADPAAAFESTFRRNGWHGTWRNGIYAYHHYHSTAHEVLGVAEGTARVQLGGESGIITETAPGDVIVIPAGVAHKNLGASSDFLVVGAYPEGQDYDMNYGRADERPAANRNIKSVPLPKNDPVFGSRGPLLDNWH